MGCTPSQVRGMCSAAVWGAYYHHVGRGWTLHLGRPLAVLFLQCLACDTGSH